MTLLFIFKLKVEEFLYAVIIRLTEEKYGKSNKEKDAILRGKIFRMIKEWRKAIYDWDIEA